MSKREAMLEAAYELVGKAGLEALHARSVAAVVGVNHAAVHYYFKTRHDLLVGLCEHMQARFDSDRQKFLSLGDDEASKLEAEFSLVEAYSKPTSRMMKVWVSLYVAAQSDVVLKEMLSKFWLQWEKGLRESIRSTKKAGVALGPGSFRDSEFLVCSLLGTAITAQLVQANFSPSDKIDTLVSELLPE